MNAIIGTGDGFYFHNLKFDGNFIVNWLLKNGWEWQKENKMMKDKHFSTVIADTGQWYSITICSFIKGERKYTYIYDSLKILPYSVKAIAKAFAPIVILSNPFSNIILKASAIIFVSR